ncbi:MAG TPA: NADH-quinone oxidoreductase subunit C [Bacteroidales bacterium]|jgi:NADH:ubiquinone oxidoreductase subunit C|nr:NADH-quinone oxidoreductase subunit C [Bacteroidales bacterium]
MTNEYLKETIAKLCSKAEFKDGPQYLEVLLPADSLHQVCLELKNNKETYFDYLFCLSGVDLPSCFEVVYHLDSTVHRHVIVLKARTAGRENPSIDTVGDIWPTAYSHEREVYDLLGVTFNNHPDMRRLFLEDGWGFPLRKDYVDPIRIVER